MIKHLSERLAQLTEDQRSLLSERVLEDLTEISGRVSEMKSIVRDTNGTQRKQAARQLRFLQAIADDHLAALNRLRAGGPHCQRCGTPLAFERLLVAPRSVECAACHPSPPTAGESREVDDA